MWTSEKPGGAADTAALPFPQKRHCLLWRTKSGGRYYEQAEMDREAYHLGRLSQAVRRGVCDQCYCWFRMVRRQLWAGLVEQFQEESEDIVHDLASGKKILKSGSRLLRRLFLFFHRGCFYEDAVPNLE